MTYKHAKVYKHANLLLMVQFLDYRQFYMCLDNELLVDSLKTDLEYFRNNWRLTGRPTLTIPVTHSLIGKPYSLLGKSYLEYVKNVY